MDLNVPEGASCAFALTEQEHAIYVAEGGIVVDREAVDSGEMVVLAGSDSVSLTGTSESRVLLIGGDPLDERHMYWNFVSNSAERIE